MKHRIGFNALSRSTAQRTALKRNMVTSLFRYERIETTKAKALEVRRMAEKMITRAKVDNVHNRRTVGKDIHDEAILAKLFKEIAPLFVDRNGGYTRILKTGNRLGDSAEMVILELVEKTAKVEKKADKQEDKKADKKADKKVEKAAEEKPAEKKPAAKKPAAKKPAAKAKTAKPAAKATSEKTAKPAKATKAKTAKSAKPAAKAEEKSAEEVK
jgi:large subunit ribosomal protein L17